MISRPQPNEHGEYYSRYIDRVPQGSDLFALMDSQPDELKNLLQGVSDEQASARPAPGEWSIKEVVGHLCDAERILAYRAVCIARADTTPLPGFEQDDYVAGTNFNLRSLSSLIDEFTFQRRANMLCFKPLTEAELMRLGTASDYPASVRALLHIMTGHVIHHIVSLKTDYKVG